MLLPASYLNGFAPRDGKPLYPSLWKGCVGAWNPGLGPSGLTLRDQSGFGRHGTLTNGPTWEANQGQYAINFDGTNDYVSCPAFARGTGAQSSVSFSAWIRHAVSGYGITFWCNSTTGFIHYSGTTGLAQRVYIGGTPQPGLNSSTFLTVGRWHHIGFIYANTTVSFYLDGRLDGTAVGVADPAFGTAVQHIGGTGGVETLNGKLSSLMFHNRALSPDEIRLLATRRGIAYEMAPRRRSSVQVTVAPLRYNLFSGSIGNTDVIGAS